MRYFVMAHVTALTILDLFIINVDVNRAMISENIIIGRWISGWVTLQLLLLGFFPNIIAKKLAFSIFYFLLQIFFHTDFPYSKIPTHYEMYMTLSLKTTHFGHNRTQHSSNLVFHVEMSDCNVLQRHHGCQTMSIKCAEIWIRFQWILIFLTEKLLKIQLQLLN